VSTRRLSLVLLALVACGCGSRVDDRNDLKVDAAPSDSDRDLSACPAGATSCAAQCVDTNHDPDHCGTCDRGCGEAEVCHDGACSIACPPELTACARGCHDLRHDPAHCGACDNTCATGQVCGEGACGVNCAGGATRCGDVCADLRYDPANCGACGVACAKGGGCNEGTCVCPAALPDVCGAKCVDKLTDPLHCGACGNSCANARCARVTLPDGSLSGSPGLTANDCVKALDVALSSSHACARVKIGTIEDVWCWGNNSMGQLGREFTASDPTPTPVQRTDGPWALGATSALTVGAAATYVKMGSVAWFWGSFTSTHRYYEPVTRAGPWDFTKSTGAGSIAAGIDHVCWTSAPRGEVRCEGANTRGQLGRPLYSSTREVTPPSDWPTGTLFRASKLSSVEHATCAIGDDGSESRRVYCWGGFDAPGIPTKVANRDASDIAVGADHGYMRDKTSGAWACWGSNQTGQCGLDRVVYGTKIVTPTDTAWSSPSLSAGVGFNCGLNGGKVFCWGTNADGQIGDGSVTLWSATPREVFGITGAVSVSASEGAACAVKDDGTIWCWGRQQKGRFGKVADGVYRSPVRVAF